jgi:hypothetical protein
VTKFYLLNFSHVTKGTKQDIKYSDYNLVTVFGSSD